MLQKSGHRLIPLVLVRREADVGQTLDVIEEPLAGAGLLAKLHRTGIVGAAGLQVERRPAGVVEGIGIGRHRDRVRLGGRIIVVRACPLEEGESLVVFLDHFDTSWVRDKAEVGRIFDEYDNIKAVLASGFDESIQKVEIHIAYEILDAITNEKMIKVATDTLEEAAELSFKYSEPGDIILHMGPLISFDRVNVLNKIMKGLKDGSRKYK